MTLSERKTLKTEKDLNEGFSTFLPENHLKPQILNGNLNSRVSVKKVFFCTTVVVWWPAGYRLKALYFKYKKY